ncbi:MAG: hypothetical protein J7K54_04950 [Candidatus Aenigmarchaeota archaeon]|nr:hypothetical protein [Candidatus Aenigmarchaeota archaeon]
MEDEGAYSGGIPYKNVGLVFFVTFILVFVLFTMVEPKFHCYDSYGNDIPCRTFSIGGDFILGLLISGVLFLFDMLLVYMTLSEYLM